MSIQDPYLNVKLFGAKGDNSTNDTAAIQACLTAAASSGYRGVIFPTAQYRCSSGLVLSSSLGLIIEGCGSQINFTGTYNEGFRCVNNSKMVIRDLRLNGPTTIDKGLHITQSGASSESILLENIYSYGFNNGICIGADTSGDVAEVTLTHCWSEVNANASYLFGNGTGGNVLDIRCYGCVARHSGYGVMNQGTIYTWRDGSVGYNTVDFKIGAHVGPLVISGVRSENSGRFVEAIGNFSFYTPVRIENSVVSNFTDASGNAIFYQCACPLTMSDVVILNGPVPVAFVLGFSSTRPLTGVFTNVATDSSNPYPVLTNAHNFTFIGGSVIQSGGYPLPFVAPS